MKSPFFNFKHFRVSHTRCAMKVGVDSVLLGAWTDADGCRRILDVGAGCGLLALMMAQRFPELEKVEGIEIEQEAFGEMSSNFMESPWNDRLVPIKGDFSKFSQDKANHGIYDLLISNPPYFDSGIEKIDTPRLLARHQDTLSPFSIIRMGKELLAPRGRVAMVVPIEFEKALIEEARSVELFPIKITHVKGNPSKQAKRTLILLEKRDNTHLCGHGTLDLENPDKFNLPVIPEILTLELKPGIPTEEHLRLCHDFYLKF